MKALIITDGTESIESIALFIKESLKGYNTKICCAKDFCGTDILPADIFFIGCESPSPDSFEYLEELLSHINFASRKCGIFSIKNKTVKYLQGILKDCEAVVNAPLFVNIDETKEINEKDIKNWVKELIHE